jgi:hypothetical protein
MGIGGRTNAAGNALQGALFPAQFPVPAGTVPPLAAAPDQIVVPPLEDIRMGISAGTRTGTEDAYATFAALAALDAEDAALASAGSGAVAGDGVDVLQRAYEIRLERMELAKKLEAQAAALKATNAAQAVDLQHAMTPPDAPLHERTFTEMSAVEEIAGILTISSGSAAAFVEQSRRMCALPPVMDALSTGSLSWQQAKIFVDETEALDHYLGGALPRPRGTQPRPRLPRHETCPRPAAREGPGLAGTAPPGIHRKTPPQERR